MKRIIFIIPLFCFQMLVAQMEDISFTLAPTAEYVWWDDQTGLANDFLYGGKIGFGFGEYLELSGIFQTSNQLQTDFSSFGFENFSNESFEPQDVTLNRYGGELKVNFSKGTFSPYATIGTGVQSIEMNDAKFEQIYAGLGLGLRLGISNRINLLVEARATGFRIDAANNLLSPANQAEYGVNLNTYGTEETLNVGARAALQIYLGGRKPGELSALDRAYLSQYQGDFKGWSWVLEPSLAYLDFDSDSFYRNTWMAGGYFGVDFTKFVGVRAYYFQSMQDESISLDFDDLNMYGLEFRAKLNDGRGVNPYLILGGGYLNVMSDYEGVLAGNGAQSAGFANAGLGLDIPLGRTILITGGVRAMATSTRNITDLNGPDVLQSHIMYNAGIKIQVGKKSNQPQQSTATNQTNALDLLQNGQDKSDVKNYNKLNELIQNYKKDLLEIDEQLEKAYQQQNTNSILLLLEEKRRVSKELREVEKMKSTFSGNLQYGTEEYLKMTPKEFEDLIDRILEGIDKKMQQDQTQTNAQLQKTDIKLLAEKVLELQEMSNQENKTIEVDTTNTSKDSDSTREEALKANAKAEKEMEMILESNSEKYQQIDKRMETLNKRIDEFSKQLEQQQNQLKKDQKSSKELKSSIDKVQKATEATDKKLKELDKKMDKANAAEKTNNTSASSPKEEPKKEEEENEN